MPIAHMAAAGGAKNVLVLGGSGFVGRSLCKQLLASNTNVNVRVISRNAKKAAALLPREVEVVEGDVLRDSNTLLPKYISSDDAVVNCIGLLFETKSRGATFENAHVGLANALVKHTPKKLVYVSALGIDKSDSKYAMSKKAAEDIYINQLADSSVSILRPSIIYGPNDSFFNRFNSMASYSPFLPLVGGGTTKYQPVHVDNVVSAIIKSIDIDDTCSYELGGKDVLSFEELMEMTMRVSGKRRLLLNLPYCVADIQGNAMEKMHQAIPGIPPLITRDQVKLLRIDNVIDTTNNNKDVLGFKELGIADEEIRGCRDDDIAYIKSK